MEREEEEKVVDGGFSVSIKPVINARRFKKGTFFFFSFLILMYVVVHIYVYISMRERVCLRAKSLLCVLYYTCKFVGKKKRRKKREFFGQGRPLLLLPALS